MIPDTPTQEQQHVTRILNQWSRIEKRLLQFAEFAYVSVLLWIMLAYQDVNFLPMLGVVTAIGLSSFFLYVRTNRYAIRRFAARLTEEEKTLLRNAIIDTTIEDNQTIKDLLIASQKQGTSKTDLLRASQSPSDETLLRPASQTEHTPAQQLLRAVPKEENERISA